MMEEQRPILVPKSHPIQTGRYLLPTSQISSLFETVTHWINCRSPGGIIYGNPRRGKTRAIQYLMHQLPSYYQDKISVFSVICRNYKTANESVFFEDLLKDIGHAFYNGRANVKRERLTKFLIERGFQSLNKRVIIIMDDAQHLHPLHYGWLMDIYNELDAQGIELNLMLVGQPELLAQKSSFIASRKAQIVGRFMIHEYEFKGLQTRQDIFGCLNSYDEEAFYPVDSACSFTQYYFFNQFQQGFRLANYTDEIYVAFDEARKEQGITGKFEIPMQFFTRMVEYLLSEYGGDGQQVASLTRKHLKDAISFSGYNQSAVIYSSMSS